MKENAGVTTSNQWLWRGRGQMTCRAGTGAMGLDAWLSLGAELGGVAQDPGSSLQPTRLERR